MLFVMRKTSAKEVAQLGGRRPQDISELAGRNRVRGRLGKRPHVHGCAFTIVKTI